MPGIDKTPLGKPNILAFGYTLLVIQRQACLINLGGVCTPIDENNNYINTSPVFVDTPGLPMHADLIYDAPTQKGVPNTKHRQFANKLAKLSNYFDDPSPTTSNWNGLQLTWAKK